MGRPEIEIPKQPFHPEVWIIAGRNCLLSCELAAESDKAKLSLNDFVIHLTHKGAAIKYVRKIFGILDPPLSYAFHATYQYYHTQKLVISLDGRQVAVIEADATRPTPLRSTSRTYTRYSL